ncbi:MAG: hypothetical protein COS68_05345 [Elusimicrobia bacterium CG06_land_8_20_14_3_00_38_11]|nr:MAG: hypothetical protein COS68_05345 [Elusimicrobia bacterium CG06_land_8_20_14_3_00_38_11]
MAAISIVLVLVIIIIYWKTVFLFGLFSAHFPEINDIIAMYFPFRSFFADSIRNGMFPLWSSDIFLGFPLHAESQGGFFYPPNILFAILPPGAAYNFVFVLHSFLSGFFTYLFARAIKLKKSASILASIVFAFSGFSAVHNEHMNLLNAISWIPLVFLFVNKISQKKLWLILSLIFANQFLSGFPQVLYYSAIVGFIYLIFLSKDLKLILRFFLAIGFAFLISFCQVLPTVELIPYSHRAYGVVKEEMFAWGYYIKDLLFFIMPYIFGNPAMGTYTRKDSLFGENCAYVGVITILIAFIYILKNFKKEKETRFFSLLLLFLIFVVLSFPYLHYLYFKIMPGFKYFRIPQRLLIFVVFSLAILSAKGLEIFPKIKFLVITAVLAELLNFSSGYNKVIDWQFFSKPEIVKILESDKELFRVYTYDKSAIAWIRAYCFSKIPGFAEITQYSFRNYLYPNTNMLYHIPSLNAYTPFVHLNEFEHFDIANVKYVISSSDLIKKKDFLLVKKINFPVPLPELKIYQNINFLPRAFITKKEKSIIKNILPVKVLDYQTTKVKIIKKEKDEGELILCDFYYPGWNVFVDGKKREISNFQSVRRVTVFQNEKKIFFVYRPLCFFSGVIISIISIFILGVLVYRVET